MKKVFLILLCVTLSAVPGQAQKRGKAKARTQVKAEPVDIEMLLNSYQFEAASEAIQDEMDKINKKRTIDTVALAVLEKQASRARMGENMLQSTEKVIFIDSVVVNKKEFLKAFRISSSCGTISMYADVFEAANAPSQTLETTVYINEFKDRMIYSSTDKTGSNKLYERMKLGSKWSGASRLVGIGESTDNVAYPYILNDGTTLYYAAEDANSFGGFDIYVTRYNPDTEQYLKPENIGMPFNSPANDYLYIIDESNNLGWFASDRNQPEGKVCIYTFIPTESRVNYNSEEVSEEQLRSLAQLRSIKESQSNKKTVAEAVARLKNVADGTAEKSVTNSDFRFFVCSGVIYKSIDSFRSAKAMELAMQWVSTSAKRNKLQEDLTLNRRQWKEKSSPSLSATILKQEKEMEQLNNAIQTLANNIRKEEIAVIRK